MNQQGQGQGQGPQNQQGQNRQQGQGNQQELTGQQRSAQDPTQLYTGSWISQRDGRLIRVQNGTIISEQLAQTEEFVQLSADPYATVNQLRLAAARQNIEPQF